MITDYLSTKYIVILSCIAIFLIFVVIMNFIKKKSDKEK